MLLTISTTYQPATDLGYLLHKHPDKVQTFKLNFGKAHVFYPESNEQKSTFSLLLDINPISIVRDRKKEALSMADYVNDRPYVSSSFMSTTITKVLGTALNGTCNDRPELVKQAIPLEVNLSAVSAKGGISAIEKVFAPLGYEIEAKGFLTDEKFPEWGESNYFELTLKNTITLKDLLTHLYVLLPVLDNNKHYYISRDEIEKLISKGGDWLQDHPAKNYIIRRYFKKKYGFGNEAFDRLNQLKAEEENNEEENTEPEEVKEKRISLHNQRLNLVTEEIVKSGAKTVVDLGCGEGKLMQRLIPINGISKIIGMDISFQTLQVAKRRLHIENMSKVQQERIQLIHGALTYRDHRIEGFDCATLVEVIEHLDEPRLEALERVVFEFAKPKTVLLTTPNGEYNIMYENLVGGLFRHNDHRFEWSRKEFKEWAFRVATTHGYDVTFENVGEEDKDVGAPSQMAIFRLK